MHFGPTMEFALLNKTPTYLVSKKQLIDYIRNAFNKNSRCVWFTSDGNNH